MKTSRTGTIDTRKKAIEFNSINLPRILAIIILIGTSSVLFYSSLYWWSVGILLTSFGAVKIYNLYKEISDFDWSIDVSDLTSEEVKADLESRENRMV